MDLNLLMKNKDIEILLNRFLKGEQSAFLELLEIYKDVINRCAKRYKFFFPNLSFDELVEEGITSLYKAIHHWKNSKSKNFQKYSLVWIKKSMKSYVIENLTLVKIPSYFLKKLKKILFFINKEEDIHKIAKKTKLDISEIKNILARQPKREISFDDYLDKDEKQETLYEILPDHLSRSLDENVLKIESIDYLHKLLDNLTDQEKEIIKWRFGLEDRKHHTIKEIAEKMNLSSQKVREIEKSAILKLKKIKIEEV